MPDATRPPAPEGAPESEPNELAVLLAELDELAPPVAAEIRQLIAWKLARLRNRRARTAAREQGR